MTLLSTLPRRAYRSMALAGGVAAAAIAFAYVGHIAREEALAERNAAAAGLKRTEARQQHLEQEREEIGRQAALFLRLQASGMVGEPAPVDWAELLENLRQQMHLPSLYYQWVQPTATAEDQGFDFHATSMQLRLQALHEEDLLHFLERLQQEAKALVLLRACRLTRLPSVEPVSSPAYLSADCEAEWAMAYKKGGEHS